MIDSLSQLHKGDSVSFLILPKEEIHHADWSNTTIETCNITSSKIKNVLLINADLISTTINNCEFEYVDFSNSDICSLISEQTKFNNSIFNVSAIRDCEFISCDFCSCSFEHVAMTHTKFVQCTFRNIDITQSSSYLNEFIDCKFIDCHFKGNFFYSLFINCDLNADFMSDYLLSYNAIIPSYCIETKNTSIETELKEKRMVINFVLFRLNKSIIDPNKYLFESLTAIHKLISNNIVVRIEQIDFIKKVAEYYSYNNAINTLSIVHAISIIDRIFEECNENSMAFKKSAESLNQFKNILFLEYIKRVNSLPIMTFDFSKSQPTIYKITYEEEPEIEISEIINSVLQKMNVQQTRSSRILSQKGSFIEFIKVIESAEPLIQIILSFTTGIIIPIVVAKLNNKKKTNKNSSNDNSINYNGKNITIINNNYNLTNFTSNQNYCAAITQVLIENNITPETNYKGYSQSNVCKIEKINEKNN